MQRDEALEIIGEIGAVLGLAAREGVLRKIVGMAQVIDARDEPPLKRAARALPGN